MKKIIILLLGSVLLFFSCNSNEVEDPNGENSQNDENSEEMILPYVDDITTVIKDPIFRRIIAEKVNSSLAQYDTEKPYGILSSDEVKKIESLDIIHYVKSIEGLEYFTGLKELEIYTHLEGEVKFENNLLLEHLVVYGFLDNYKKLNVSNLTKLTYLRTRGNDLESLDLSKNINLVELDLENTNLETLDLSNNTTLKKLNYSSYNLGNISFSKNNILEDVSLHFDPNTTNVDLSALTKVKSLSVNLDYHPIAKKVILPHSPVLTSLNIEGSIKEFNCSHFTTLKDVSIKIELVNNKIDKQLSIDLRNNKDLRTCQIENREYSLNKSIIASVDLGKCTELITGYRSTFYIACEGLQSVYLPRKFEREYLSINIPYYENIYYVD